MMNKKYMRLALNEARKNFKKMDGGPFGSCIVKGGRVLAISRNMVLKKDATCHAEINAIRQASKKIKNFDLSGCSIYSSTEPCPMCFSAIHWARIDTLIYGTGIKDARRLGFNELAISVGKMKKIGRCAVKIHGGFLFDECKGLLKEWDRLENKIAY